MSVRDIARGHLIERVNPKGEPFRGICILCGKEELTMKNAQDVCENPRGLSKEETLQLAICGPIKIDEETALKEPEVTNG